MVTTELRGRLGNQMFQYSICRIIAEKNNYKFHIPSEKSDHGQNLSHYFEGIDMGVTDGNINNSFVEDHTVQKFNSTILNLPDFTRISGFFQSEKYFEGYEDKIKEWFQLAPNKTVDELLVKYPTNEYCCIHFRGGDYMDIPEWLLPIDYYLEGIKRVSELNSDMKFLVITDSADDARKYFKDFDIITNDIVVDFSLLYHSKYSIIPNSTFSWWAAWLSDKEMTIAPDRWLNYNRVSDGFSPVDIKSKKFIYI